jgi:hypothetical protein
MNATAAAEVLDLFEGAGAGDDMEPPIEGEAATIEAAVFAQIEAGACFLNIKTATVEAPAAAPAGAAPATPPAGGATPATPPAGGAGNPPATPPAGGATPPPAG